MTRVFQYPEGISPIVRCFTENPHFAFSFRIGR